MKEKKVLNSYSDDVQKFVDLLKRFNEEVERLRPKFNQHVDGIDIEFDKVWVHHAGSGNLRNAIGIEFEKYLGKYPKFHRRAIDQYFTEQIEGLYSETGRLETYWRQIHSADRHIPLDALERFFRFNDDGTVIIDTQSIRELGNEISLVVDTPEREAMMEAFDAFYEAYGVFRSKVGAGEANAFLFNAVSKNNDDLTMESVRKRTKSSIESIIRKTK